MQRKVLVVDDEHLVADTLALIFRKHGFECRTSYTGVEALACLDTFHPELLLCDMTMPGISGLEVAAGVARKWPDCRILLLTGHYQNLSSARRWIRTHSDRSRVMTKPVLPNLLLDEAKNLLHCER